MNLLALAIDAAERAPLPDALTSPESITFAGAQGDN